MSSKRLVASCAAVALVVLSSGWQAARAFPLEQGADAEAILSNTPGPIEQRAKPITPENPIPRRTYHVLPDYPSELLELAARGAATVRVTLDEAGHLVEARVTGVTLSAAQFGLRVEAAAGTHLSDMITRVRPEHQPAAAKALAAMARAAATAVRQWQYDPPADGPISFPATVAFTREGAGAPVFVAGEIYYPPNASGPGRAPSAANMTLNWDNALRVGGAIKAPTKLYHVNPEYPPIARDAAVQGIVIIEARIEADGSVGAARVLRSIPLLDQAALHAVSQWRFEPTLLNGQPVPIIMTVTVNFTLQ